jgi:hypothetical protein
MQALAYIGAAAVGFAIAAAIYFVWLRDRGPTTTAGEQQADELEDIDDDIQQNADHLADHPDDLADDTNSLLDDIRPERTESDGGQDGLLIDDWADLED